MRFLGNFVALLILLSLAVSCTTTQKHGTKTENVSSKEKDKLEDKKQEKESNLISYGNNNEVQLYITNNIRYYVIGNNQNVEKMTERELKYNSIDTSIVKISHTNMSASDGIMLTYYDIRIFLAEKSKSGNTIVGIYEPARATWVFGDDINTTGHSIEIKNGKYILGPVKIELRSMSRLYK